MANKRNDRATVSQLVDEIIKKDPAVESEFNALIEEYKDAEGEKLAEFQRAITNFLNRIFVEHSDLLPERMRKEMGATCLAELLYDLSEDEVKTLRKVFGVADAPEGTDVEDLRKELCEAMVSPEQMQEKFGVLSDRTIEAFEAVLAKKNLTPDDLAALSVLDDLSYITLYQNGICLLTPDLVAAYNELNTPEFQEKRRHDHRLIGCLYLFSVLYAEAPLKVLLRLYNKAASGEERITIDELKERIAGLPPTVGKVIITEVDGKEMLRIEHDREQEMDRAALDTISKVYQLYLPSEQEVKDIVAYRYPKTQQQYATLENFLTKQCGMPATELSWIMESTWEHFTAGYSVNEVVNFYLNTGVIPNNNEVIDIMMTMLDRVAANTRMFDFRGSTPAEMGLK